MPLYADVELAMAYQGHRDAVYTLVRGPQPGQFFSTGADGVVALWQAGLPDALQAVLLSSHPVYCLLYDPARECLFAGRNDGGLLQVHLPSRRTEARQAHTDALFDLALLPGGFVLAASRDARLSLWEDAGVLLCLRQWPVGVPARCVLPWPGRGWLVGGIGPKVQLVSEEGAMLKTLHLHETATFRLAFDANGHLLSAGQDARLKRWNPANLSAPELDLVAHTQAINDVVPSPGGQFVATCSMDDSIKLWRARDLKLLKVLHRSKHPMHTNCVNRLLWLSDTELLSAADDRMIYHWRIAWRPHALED